MNLPHLRQLTASLYLVASDIFFSDTSVNIKFSCIIKFTLPFYVIFKPCVQKAMVPVYAVGSWHDEGGQFSFNKRQFYSLVFHKCIHWRCKPCVWYSSWNQDSAPGTKENLFQSMWRFLSVTCCYRKYWIVEHWFPFESIAFLHKVVIAVLDGHFFITDTKHSWRKLRILWRSLSISCKT